MASTPQERFDAAVKVIQTIPKDGTFMPSQDMMLRFYAFFKQATQGPCTTARPAFWDIIGKAKWDAWHKLGDMETEEAMKNYVDELKKIVEAMPHTEDVQSFVEKLGDFYETIDEVPPRMDAEVWRKRQLIYAKTPQPDANHNAVNGVLDAETNGSEILAQTVPVTLKPAYHIKSSPGSRVSSKPPVPNGRVPAVNGHHRTDLHDDLKDDAPPITGDTTLTPPTYTHVPPTNGNILQTPPTNGLSHQSEDEAGLSSEGEEFCDTSDSPLLHTEDQFGATLWTSVGNQQSQNICTDNSFNQSDSGISNSHQSEARDSVPISPTVGQDYSEQPIEISGRTWSSVGLSELDGIAKSANVCGDLEQYDTVVGRGGGETSTEGGMAPLSLPGPSGVSGSRGGGVVGSGGRREQLMGAGGSAGGGGHEGGAPPRVHINEQIAVTLLRLQQDMNSVLGRLHDLELQNATNNRVRSHRSRSSSHSENGVWWPFSQLNKTTLFFVVVWPFIVHWILGYLRRRSQRRWKKL